jgi:hypothetical protein
VSPHEYPGQLYGRCTFRWPWLATISAFSRDTGFKGAGNGAQLDVWVAGSLRSLQRHSFSSPLIHACHTGSHCAKIRCHREVCML